ncbi:MAG TPA: hypothetical protein VGP93_20420 [Polyangiaceae bacterium]|nr:hypothetical protein [Polyangiaceae bacterium]
MVSRPSRAGKMLGVLRLLTAALSACAACGGTSSDDGGSAAAATPADVGSMCAAICSRDSRCTSATPTCVQDCEDDFPAAQNVKQGFVERYSSCIENLACDSNDDVCVESAILAEYSDPESSPLFQKCNDVQNRCDTFSDDSCVGAFVFTPAVQTQMSACLDLSCNEAGSCIDGLLR